MRITHSEVTAGLWFLVAVSSGTAGLVAGHWWWPSKRRLEDEFFAGRDAANRDAFDRAEKGGVLRSGPGGVPGWCDAGSQRDRDGAGASVAFSEPATSPPRPGSVTERLPVADEGHSGPGHQQFGRLPAPTVSPEPTADGAFVAGGESVKSALVGTGRTIYPELAAIARRDAERDSAATEHPALPVDPHWYANGLHWLADWQAAWHEDAARWDAWLPGYLADYRASLEPAWSAASRMLEAL